MADNRKSQADRILTLLDTYNGEWVALPRIMGLGIASHTRRISDLRKRGLNVECRKEWIDGQLHTAYRIIPTINP